MIPSRQPRYWRDTSNPCPPPRPLALSTIAPRLGCRPMRLLPSPGPASCSGSGSGKARNMTPRIKPGCRQPRICLSRARWVRTSMNAIFSGDRSELNVAYRPDTCSGCDRFAPSTIRTICCHRDCCLMGRSGRCSAYGHHVRLSDNLSLWQNPSAPVLYELPLEGGPHFYPGAHP